jgi:hypothetical protein
MSSTKGESTFFFCIVNAFPQPFIWLIIFFIMTQMTPGLMYPLPVWNALRPCYTYLKLNNGLKCLKQIVHSLFLGI